MNTGPIILENQIEELLEILQSASFSGAFRRDRESRRLEPGAGG
jgi:hypothetical protein